MVSSEGATVGGGSNGACAPNHHAAPNGRDTKPILAAIASIERRASLLPSVLESLRPHVDRLCVYLNGWREAPTCVRELADEFVLSAENRGAEKKVHWACSHHGIYLSCDDDFVYPQDYVPTLVGAVERWDGRAIVTAHGRTYEGAPQTVHDVRGAIGFFYGRIDEGRWINHGGTGVMAWDASKVRVPTEWPERNMLDMQLAVWAQRERVPMWLVPHPAKWLGSLADLDPHGIFVTSRSEGHRRRNELLQRHGREHGWKLHTVSA